MCLRQFCLARVSVYQAAACRRVDIVLLDLLMKEKSSFVIPSFSKVFLLQWVEKEHELIPCQLPCSKGPQMFGAKTSLFTINRKLWRKPFSPHLNVPLDFCKCQCIWQFINVKCAVPLCSGAGCKQMKIAWDNVRRKGNFCRTDNFTLCRRLKNFFWQTWQLDE